MTKEESRELYRQALGTWGLPTQAMMVIEECSELINAMCKYDRGRVNENDIITEIVDVMIMCEQIQEMLFSQKNINWNNFPADCKRGSCCIQENGSWIIDTEIPIFKNEGRDYIEKLIN